MGQPHQKRNLGGVRKKNRTEKGGGLVVPANKGLTKVSKNGGIKLDATTRMRETDKTCGITGKSVGTFGTKRLQKYVGDKRKHRKFN